MTVVLGIDPGTARMGYGVIRHEDGLVQYLDAGCLETFPNESADRRLLRLYQGLTELFGRHPHISEVALEKLYFNRNVTTALAVGEARGIAQLMAAQQDCVVEGYTPSEIKEALTGYGKADKKQVEQAVKIQLGIGEELKLLDDAWDGLAIALTHVCFGVLRGELDSVY